MPSGGEELVVFLKVGPRTKEQLPCAGEKRLRSTTRTRSPAHAAARRRFAPERCRRDRSGPSNATPAGSVDPRRRRSDRRCCRRPKRFQAGCRGDHRARHWIVPCGRRVQVCGHARLKRCFLRFSNSSARTRDCTVRHETEVPLPGLYSQSRAGQNIGIDRTCAFRRRGRRPIARDDVSKTF
jgi:hypothetical protein